MAEITVHNIDIKETPLYKACMEGDVKEVFNILEKENIDINKKNDKGVSPLHVASYFGHDELVKKLIEAGAKVDIEDENKDTPLIYACSIPEFDAFEESSNKSKIIDILLDHKANIDKKSDIYDTPLFMAIENEHPKLVEKLIAKGADVYQLNKYGENPLIKACNNHMEGDEEQFEIIKTLLRAETNLLSEKVPSNGNTPLIIACRKNDRELVDFLLRKAGSEVVNAANKDGNTALMEASESGFAKIVQLLLNRFQRIDMDKKNKKGKTAFELAMEGHHEEVVKAIDKHQLFRACEEGNLEQVNALIERGVDLNMTQNLKTPLQVAKEEGNSKVVERIQEVLTRQEFFRACEKGDIKKVERLLDEGFDILNKNREGKIPLEVAKANNHSSLIKLLEKKENEKQLLQATENGRLNQVKELLSKDIDVMVKNKNRETAFELASKKGHLSILKLLLSYDKNNEVNIGKLFDIAKENQKTEVTEYFKKEYSETLSEPLFKAIEAKNNNKVKEILKKERIDINEYRKGQTPLIAACNAGNKEAVELLVNKGADVNKFSTDQLQESPIIVALEYKNEDMINILLNAENINLNHSNSAGKSPVYLASKLSKKLGTEVSKEYIKKMLDKGADIDQIHKSETPLTKLIQENDKKAVQNLLECGVDVNKPNKDGQTPLMLACRYNDNAGIVKLLIEQNADVNATSYDLHEQYIKSPLLESLRSDYPTLEIVNTLLENGAEVKEPPSTYDLLINDPLKYAERKKISTPIINLLKTYKNCKDNLSKYYDGNPWKAIGKALWDYSDADKGNFSSFFSVAKGKWKSNGWYVAKVLQEHFSKKGIETEKDLETFYKELQKLADTYNHDLKSRKREGEFSKIISNCRTLNIDDYAVKTGHEPSGPGKK